MSASEYQPLLDAVRERAMAGLSAGGIRGAGVNPLAAALAAPEGPGRALAALPRVTIVPGLFKPSPEGMPAEYQQGHPIGLPPTPVGQGGGQGNLGGAAIAAGLGQLGQGIEGGLETLAEKQKKADALASYGNALRTRPCGRIPKDIGQGTPESLFR